MQLMDRAVGIVIVDTDEFGGTCTINQGIEKLPDWKINNGVIILLVFQQSCFSLIEYIPQIT